MSELTLTLIKLGFLALLWMFVLAVLSVIRSDLFGAKVDSRAAGAAVAQNSRTPKPAKPVKKRKGLPGSVTIADGPQAGVGATLVTEPVIIGRGSDCQIRLDDDYSSTRHARLFLSEGQWWVEDLGSTNGTYLDGQRVTRPVPAEIGGSIRIGRTTLNIAKSACLDDPGARLRSTVRRRTSATQQRGLGVRRSAPAAARGRDGRRGRR